MGEVVEFVHFIFITFCKIDFFSLGAKDFRHQYTLMRHLPTHTDERKYTCDVCNKSFRQVIEAINTVP